MVVSTDKVAYLLGRGRQKTKRCLHLQATDNNYDPFTPINSGHREKFKIPFFNAPINVKPAGGRQGMGWGFDCLCWPWGRAFD